jgi:hypothetical protein
MVKMTTVNGVEFEIDEEDVERVSTYRWYESKSDRKKAYIFTAISTRLSVGRWKNRTVYLHRFLIDAPRGLSVDHKDNDTMNNQKSNLRLATQSQQNQNTKKLNPSTASSRFKGVSFNKKRNVWEVYVHDKRKKIVIGYFQNEEEAARAYDNAARSRYGEFASTNF